jgi:hypothetical protein
MGAGTPSGKSGLQGVRLAFGAADQEQRCLRPGAEKTMRPNLTREPTAADPSVCGSSGKLASRLLCRASAPGGCGSAFRLAL